MSSKRFTPRQFLFVLLGLVFLLCSPLLLSYRFLKQNGETLSPVEIVDRLQANPEAYYRSAMHDNLRETALEILKRRQPEVVALGSSLSFDFREEYFSSSFGCGCGVMDSLSDGEVFVQKMLEVSHPKVVLFVLDFWWFTDDEVRPRGELAPLDQSPRFSFSKLKQPYKLIGKKQLTVSQFLGFEPLPSSPVVANPAIGLMAEEDNVGRRFDGSQLNGIVFSERAKEFYAPVREYFTDAKNFVLKPGRFGPDRKVHPERIALLQRLVKQMEDAGAHVVLLYPPMAPPIAQAMAESGRHEYISELGKQLKALGFEAYDFHSPQALGIPTSEYSDTHHAGNTAYMRLLAEIVRQHPESPLAKRVKRDEIIQRIEQFKGTTVAVLEKDRIQAAETDFLGLGVTKTNAPHLSGQRADKR